jgi:hypothetical protein
MVTKLMQYIWPSMFLFICCMKSPIDRNSMQARNGSGSTPNFTGSVDGFSASGSGAAPGSAGPGDSAAPSMMMYSTTPHRDAFSNDYSASLGMGSSGATYFGSGGYGSDFVDIVIADPLHFDPLIFDCWLEGRTPEFAVNAKLSRQKQSRAGSVNHMEQGPSLLSPSPGSAGLPSQQLSRQPAPTPTPPVPSSANSLATPPQHGSLSSAVHRQQTYPDDDVDSTWGSDPLLLELLRHDALDQYHTYEILEHYMKYPSLLAQQTMTHITPPARAYMVERYFALDEAAAREILSRRMGRSRKDLEEVCEASGLPLNAVTRYIYKDIYMMVKCSFMVCHHCIPVLFSFSYYLAFPCHICVDSCPGTSTTFEGYTTTWTMPSRPVI